MIILLLLAVLFLAVVVSAMVLVFFRPWRILRGEQDQHQDLESAAPEPREVPETASEDDYRGEGGEG
jgi:flagellar basal body-associated protein FliL